MANKKQERFKYFQLIKDDGKLNTDYPRNYNLHTGMCDNMAPKAIISKTDNIIEVEKRKTWKQ